MAELLKDYHPPGTAPGTLHPARGEGERVRVLLTRYRDAKPETQEFADVRELAAAMRGAELSWVHVIGLGDIKALERLGELFELHPLALEDVTRLGQRPKVETYADQLFVILQHMEYAQEQTRFTQFALFLRKNCVITFQPSRSDLLEPLRRRMPNGTGGAPLFSADYLAYSIIDLIIDSAFPALEAFGNRMEALEDEILRNPNRQVMARIHGVRRQLVHLRRILWPQRDVIVRLMRNEQDLISPDVIVYLRDSSDHAVQAMDVVESYREMAASLLDVHLSNTNVRLTEVMRVLTVIATLFTPPIFVTSIYGMNFDRSHPLNMPELGWEYGYLMVWGIIISIIIGMLLYFRRKRWM